MPSGRSSAGAMLLRRRARRIASRARGLHQGLAGWPDDTRHVLPELASAHPSGAQDGEELGGGREGIDVPWRAPRTVPLLVQPDIVEAVEAHVLVEPLDRGLHRAEPEDVAVADGRDVLVEALLDLVPLRLPVGGVRRLPDRVQRRL